MLLQDLVHELLVIVDVVAEPFYMPTIPLASSKACASHPHRCALRGSQTQVQRPSQLWDSTSTLVIEHKVGEAL